MRTILEDLHAFRNIRQLVVDQGWRAHLRVHERWFGTPYRHVERFVPASGLILDLGCGVGLFAALLVLGSPRRSVHGWDTDGAKVAMARRMFGELPGVTFDRADLADLPLPACDGVVLYDVLHHLPPQVGQAVIARAAQALRPGGRVVIKETDTAPGVKLRMARLLESVAYGLALTQGAPCHFHSRAEWAALLGSHGLRVVHDEHVRTPYGFFVPHALVVAEKPA